MNMEALFLFLILLLGLVFASFLGKYDGNTVMPSNYYEGFAQNGAGGPRQQPGQQQGRQPGQPGYDNYNHYTGSSTQLKTGAKYQSEQGGSIEVVSNSDGTQSLSVTLPGSTTPVTFTPTKPTTTTTTTDTSSNNVEGYTNVYGPNGVATIFYGPNGETATIIHTQNGQQAIRVETYNGTYVYTESGNAYYNPYQTTSTQYYGSTGYTVPPYNGPYGGNVSHVEGPYGAEAGSVTGPAGNTAYYAQGPAGNTAYGTDYYSSLPPGIPRSAIPPGQEDLYILKSEVVPPVCPACPVAASCPRQEQCPPCPACARCPEPAFECKKVPNYNVMNSDFLPAPVLSDFSSFGM